MIFLPPYHNDTVRTADGAQLQYLTLGDGPISVMLIPGAGDGLNTVGRAALQLAWMYRKRARNYRMLIVSRRIPIPANFSIEGHADDFIWLLEKLQWGPTILECNSAGGPVGQWMAIKRPDLVRGLVLASTLHRPAEPVQAILKRWLGWIRNKQWSAFMWDSVVQTYTKRLAFYRLLRPFLGLLKPSDPSRIEYMLEELLHFDNRPILPRIQCPTLVIAGAQDPICPPDLQREMAQMIPNSRLVLCAGYRHGNDVENPAYQQEFAQFVQQT